MRTILTSMLLLAVCLLSAQSNQTKNEVVFNNLAVDLTVKDKDDFDQIDFEAINSLFQESEGENLSFKLACNTPYESDYGKIESFSYSVVGTSEKMDLFLKKVDKVKKAFHTIYKN
jgi:hypothetical protein